MSAKFPTFTTLTPSNMVKTREVTAEVSSPTLAKSDVPKILTNADLLTGNYTKSGRATVFGYRDTGDKSGIGSSGINTNNTSVYGVALPIRRVPGSPSTIKNPMTGLKMGDLVEVYNNDTGKSMIVPIVDNGPSDSSGNAIDLTYATARDLGVSDLRNNSNSGSANVTYRVLSSDEQAKFKSAYPNIVKGDPNSVASANSQNPADFKLDANSQPNVAANTSQTESFPNPNHQPSAVGLNSSVGGNGSSRGMLSIPAAGAKVWVFFHGGDPQRPVYFASCPEPQTVHAAIQSASDPTLLGNYKLSDGGLQSISADILNSTDGGFRFVTNRHQAADEAVGNTLSFSEWQSVNSNMRLDGHGAEIFTAGSSTFESGMHVQNSDEEVRVINGTSFHNIGSLHMNIGSHTTEAKNAADDVQTQITAVEKAKSDAIKSTSGSKVECPICAQTYLHDKSEFVQKVVSFLGKIANMLPWNCWNWPVTQFLLNMIVIPMMSEISGLACSGGKGCGACKNGQIESPQDKISAGNDAAAKELKNRQSAIDTASKQQKESSYTAHVNGDVAIVAGLARNDAPAHTDTGILNPIVNKADKALKASCLVHKSEGTPNIVVKNEPTQTIGSILLDSANGIKMIAGSPGFDIITNGNYKISAGSIDLTSAEGPITISSKNVTTISGQTVVISDTNDGGVRMQAKNVSIGGAAHIDGDMSLKGSLSMDGSLSVKHLIMPSMRSETTMSSSPKSVTDGATWYMEGAPALTITDMTRNMLMRNLNPGWLLTPTGIITIIQETYNSMISMIPIHPIPIGFCITYPQGFTPVFGFRHTHSIVPQDHSHQITLPKGNYYNDTSAWHQARPETSSTPTPAPGQGDGPSPGPKSTGGCGGGGAGFSNPNSTSSINRNKRNASVGLAPGDYDYSKIVTGDNWTYDPLTGTLIPAPTFGLSADC